ncbi:MAG: class I SAM-dependent methyltransferase [Ignavibacteriae bacterium]|nr:class I SAM-dependent methyltransferase [Ignavibacteriota bacterium]NOG99598.1 class I SAM-dependent methyltransferase [Ignavibacteriota bacterium]
MKSESKMSVAESLEADEELVQYMPYMLQDLWALGSSADQIVQIFESLTFPKNNNCVLDLACGKGAVSVKLAKEFGYSITGVDAMPEFIDDANRYAKSYHVENLCKFIVDDILIYTKKINSFHAVILASLGGIFGNNIQTINTLRNQVARGGYIIIDDGYLKSKSSSNRKGYENYSNYRETKRELSSAGDKIIKEVSTTEFNKIINDEYLKNINKRCDELINKHPDKRDSLLKYIDLQKEECKYLEKELEGVIWVIQKK